MKYIDRDPLPEPIATWYRNKIAVGASAFFDDLNQGWDSDKYDECRETYINHIYVSTVWFLGSVFLFPVGFEMLTLFDNIGYTFSRHGITMILTGSLAAGHRSMKFNLKENNEIEKSASTAWVHTGVAFLITGGMFQSLSTFSPQKFYLNKNGVISDIFVENINLMVDLTYYWAPFALSITLVITIIQYDSQG